MKKNNSNSVVVFHNPLLKGGFSQMPSDVLKCPIISPTAKTVYNLLLSFAWQDEFAFPSQSTLSKCLGFKDKVNRMIRKYLTELENFGIIKIQRQGLNKPNIYHLLDFYKTNNELFSINFSKMEPEELEILLKKFNSNPSLYHINNNQTQELHNCEVLESKLHKNEVPKIHNDEVLKIHKSEDKEYTNKNIKLKTNKPAVDIFKNFSFDEKTKTSLLRKYSEKIIQEKINFTDKKEGIENKEAFLLSALKGDWKDKEDIFKEKKYKEDKDQFAEDQKKRKEELETIQKKEKVSKWILENSDKFNEMIEIERIKASNMGTWFSNWDIKQQNRFLEVSIRAKIQTEILKI